MKCPRPLHCIALSLILSGMVAGHAHADQVCDLIDGNTGTEDAGGSSASGTDAIACGYNDTAFDGAAFGRSNAAFAAGSSAFGTLNSAVGPLSSAFGYFNQTASANSNAFGFGNQTNGDGSNAFGRANTVDGLAGNAFGAMNRAQGLLSNAFGFGSVAYGQSSIAIGSWVDLNGNATLDYDIDLDGDDLADASSETALAVGAESVAIGPAASATGDQATAIGPRTLAAVAVATAMSSCAGQNNRNRLCTAFGYQKGQAALSIGYQRLVDEKSTFSITGALGRRGANTVGVGYGFGW